MQNAGSGEGKGCKEDLKRKRLEEDVGFPGANSETCESGKGNFRPISCQMSSSQPDKLVARPIATKPSTWVDQWAVDGQEGEKHR